MTHSSGSRPIEASDPSTRPRGDRSASGRRHGARMSALRISMDVSHDPPLRVVFERLADDAEERADTQGQGNGRRAEVAAERYATDEDTDLERGPNGGAIAAASLTGAHQKFEGSTGGTRVNDNRNSGGQRHDRRADEEHPAGDRLGCIDQTRAGIDRYPVGENIGHAPAARSLPERGRGREENSRYQPHGLAEAQAEPRLKTGYKHVEGGQPEVGLPQQSDCDTYE